MRFRDAVTPLVTMIMASVAGTTAAVGAQARPPAESPPQGRSERAIGEAKSAMARIVTTKERGQQEAQAARLMEASAQVFAAGVVRHDCRLLRLCGRAARALVPMELVLADIGRLAAYRPGDSVLVYSGEYLHPVLADGAQPASFVSVLGSTSFETLGYGSPEQAAFAAALADARQHHAAQSRLPLGAYKAVLISDCRFLGWWRSTGLWITPLERCEALPTLGTGDSVRATSVLSAFVPAARAQVSPIPKIP